MSNRDRAAEVIRDFLRKEPHSTMLRNRLENEGLLAPDLPEPRMDIDGWQVWGHKHGNHVSLQHGMVTVVMPDDISRDLTIKEARDLAARLNAAADRAQQGEPK